MSCVSNLSDIFYFESQNIQKHNSCLERSCIIMYSIGKIKVKPPVSQYVTGFSSSHEQIDNYCLYLQVYSHIQNRHSIFRTSNPYVHKMFLPNKY